MTRERLRQILKQWEEKKKWWEKMDKAAAWVDNGKGGSYNTEQEIVKCNVRIELLNQLIKEP